MDGRRTGVLKVMGLQLGLICLTGCGLFERQPPPTPLPVVLPPMPTRGQVIEAVNRNSRGINNFVADRAQLSGPGFPTLDNTSIVFERPRRLRLQAGLALTGTTELDLGSNDELFWLWIRRNEPKALYYCRHDRFAQSPARRMIPIEPDWLVEALGVVQLDPNLQHEGPYPLSDGRLEIRTIRQTPEGPAAKLTIVQGATGVVLEQHAYDAYGRLVASAVASQHRREPVTGLIMPRVVDIQCPGAQFSMQIDLGNVRINEPVTSGAVVFAMPQYEGWPPVDLCGASLPFTPASPPPTVSGRPQGPYRGRNRLLR